MNTIKTLFIAILMISGTFCVSGQTGTDAPKHEVSIKISKKYINLPVSQAIERGKMKFEVDGSPALNFLIRLAPDKPDYWVFYDVAAYMGKNLKIGFIGNPGELSKIYQADAIEGQDSLYKEKNRPQLHFTTRRGWNNDPNGMVYYEGEYHLFYQHNPFEREWENMSWGHAVSKDLIHWTELPVALYPDELGTIFSGTAVIDYNNTSGFGKNGIPPMIAIYTADTKDNERQCIAYSLDKGRTFDKFKGNPVIDSFTKWNSKDLRDPHVFWYEPAKNWVMVLYERDGNSIYTSKNLKEWNFESHIAGFYECPQLFELKVDGNTNNKKWVMYGASGTYMIGSFDGKQFVPESGKHGYGNGSLYAAMTFNNIPESDGRRIQIGWGRIQHEGMPFNGMMLLPTELTLRSTKEGVRMFNNPVKEVDLLQKEEHKWEDLTADKASELLNQFGKTGSLRIKTTIKLSHSTTAGLNLFGQSLVKYDMNHTQINGLFYSPEVRTSMEISADIIIDKTSVEVFIDGGAFSYAIPFKADPKNKEGFKFFGKNLVVKSLKVYPMKSIWSEVLN